MKKIDWSSCVLCWISCSVRWCINNAD